MQPIISMKRSKSATVYPKKIPTYIVAFAVNENIKKPSTEDVILNKTSRKNSGTSVTSTTSTKTFIIKTSKQNIVVDVGDNVPDKMLSETKESFEVNVSEAPNSNNSNFNNILYLLNINESTQQPQILFTGQKHARKSKFNYKTNRRKSKNKRMVKVKNIKFKIHRAGNMTTNLTRNCKKVYKRFDNPREIQRELDSEAISTRVCRTRVLKKVLAKENLLADAELSTTSLIRASPLSDNPSAVSSSSQNTLTCGSSPNSINSVILVRDINTTPHKADVINIAVAQISKTLSINKDSVSTLTSQNTNFRDNLTSYESPFDQTLILTSKILLEDTKSNKKNIISDAGSSNFSYSDITLIPPETESMASSDIFRIIDTRSQESKILTDGLEKNSSTKQLQDYICLNSNQVAGLTENDFNRRSFFDACMNLKIYPATIRTNSVPDLPKNKNVIIAEDITKATQKIHENNKIIDNLGNTDNNFTATIFKKPLNLINDVDYQKTLNLPNAEKIKQRIVDTLETQRKYSEEVRDTYPNSFPELCEKLTLIFEMAIKRLEQTLSEKIINELKRSVHEISKYNQPSQIIQEETNLCTSADNEAKLESPNISKIAVQEIPQSDAYLQCEIVKNEVIDKLMVDFCEEPPKNNAQSSSSIYTHKLKKPKFVNNCVEVLKAPVPNCNIPEVGKGDSVQISIEDSAEQQMPQFANKNRFWSLPIIAILRENMFVVTSVPAFLFVMFVIYSYVMLIFRMWYY